MKQFKRALSIAVALCMMLSLLPTMTFAAGQSSCKVTFMVDGSVYKEETVELAEDAQGFVSGTVTKPEDPTKEPDAKRYEFSGWKTEAGTDFFRDSDSEAVSKDLTLNAAWIEYLAEGYELVLSSNTVSQDYKTPISQIPGYDAEAIIRKIEKKRTKVAESVPVAKVGSTDYYTLQDAVNAAQDGNVVKLLTNIGGSAEGHVDALTSRVEVNPGNNNSITIDLNGKTISVTHTSGNGSAFNIKSGTVTIQNGTIDGTGVEEGNGSSIAVADGICLVTVRSGATLNLDGINMVIKSMNGSCVYPFDGGAVNISGGTYENQTTEAYQYNSSFKAMTVNQANVNTQLIHITGGCFIGNNPADGDDSGKASTFLAASAAAYYNVDNSRWVVTTPIEAAKAVAERFGKDVYNKCGSNATVAATDDYYISLPSKPDYVGATATSMKLSVGNNSQIQADDFTDGGKKVAWPVVLTNTAQYSTTTITSTQVNGTPEYTTLVDNGSNNYTVVQDYNNYGSGPFIGFGIDGTGQNDVFVTKKVNTSADGKTVSTNYGVTTSDGPSYTGGNNYGISLYWPGYNKPMDQVRAMDGATLDYYVYNTKNSKTVNLKLTLDCKPNVAKIGNTEYKTLKAALDAATDGDTIILQEDASLTERLFINAGANPAYAGTNNRYATTSVDKAITLNLNGHNITSSSNLALAGGSLNITNTGTADATHGVISTSNSGLAPVEIRGTGNLSDKRTLTIGTGVTLQGSCYGLNVFGSNDAQKNLIDVTVNGTVKGTLFVLGNLKNTGNAINIVVNGTVNAPNFDADEPNVGIALNGYANVTVNSGASVKGDSGIEIRAGSLTVNGGTITTNGGSFQEMANNNGSTVIGAAVAVSQHSTDLATSVTILNGQFTGSYALYEKDIQNETARDKITLSVTGGTFNGSVSSQNCTGFITGGSFSADPSAYLLEGYDAVKSNNTWTVRTHTHSYEQPDWTWRRIDGKWAAVATFTCVKGDDTQNIHATVTSNSEAGTTTYTAKATFQNQEYTCPEQKTETISYTVTFAEGNYSNSTFHWGDLCTLTYGDGNTNRKWYMSSDDNRTNAKLVADGRGSYTFAVTGVSYVWTDDTQATTPVAVANVTLTSTVSGQAVYNVKWSLPTDAQNVTAKIHRGAKSNNSFASRDLLESKGIHIDTGLNVRNGDFTLRISKLTPTKYQNVITVITYESGGHKYELVTPVFHIQADGSSASTSDGSYSNTQINS